MATLELVELAEATGGSLVRGEPAARVDAFFIDSRLVRPSSAFFALRGRNTDGHAYVADAAAAGATVAVVEREPEPGSTAPPGLIVVRDAGEALGRAGAWVRRRRDDVQWIGLTGSNGKTTTKEMIAAALAAGRRVHRTPGNYNNQLGVPLTLLALPDDAEIAVVELAMSGPGEIAALGRMTDPDVALVTNVRPVHMAFFASLDDVAAAKGELFAVLRDEATAVVNLDDPHVRVQATRHAGPRVTFGRHPEADLRLDELEAVYVPGAALSLHHGGRQIRLRLRIGGLHAAANALAALATVVAAGGDILAAAHEIEHVEAGPGRGKVHRLRHGIVLVDESYNSSPPALASVLETLRQTPVAGRRVLIMGDMLELGPMEAALHREAGKRAAAAGVALLIAIGPLGRLAAEAARRAGVAGVQHQGDAETAAAAALDSLQSGDLVVVKGSRGMHLERAVDVLVRALGEER